MISTTTLTSAQAARRLIMLSRYVNRASPAFPFRICNLKNKDGLFIQVPEIVDHTYYP